MDWKGVFPQPVGILPYPFNFIILPYSDRWKDCINSVLLLKFDDIPPEWDFLPAVKNGLWETAFYKLSNLQEDDLKNYNLSLLTGERRKVRDQVLEYMLNVAFFKDFDIEDTGRDDLNALILYSKAQTFEEQGKTEDALSLLESALKLVKSISPIFEALILFKKTKLLIEHRGVSYAAVALLEELQRKLSDTGADYLKAEISFNLGNAYSSLGNLTNAVKYYWEALEFFTYEKNPYMYALINNNMGLAHLSVGVSDLEDQVRLAYGVQCLKNALKVFTRDTYPKEWASTTMNYANALQYLPTADPIKNLLKALDLYREVLEYRMKMRDEVGCARTLANMGNALAHLGKLSEAKDHLIKALEIFKKHGMEEEASGILEILEEIYTLMEVRNDGRT